MALDLQEWIKIMEGFENGNSKNSTPTNTPKIEQDRRKGRQLTTSNGDLRITELGHKTDSFYLKFSVDELR